MVKCLLNSKTTRNRKGGAAIYEVVALAIVIIVLVLGFFLWKIISSGIEDSKEKELEKQKINFYANSNLVAFLQQQYNGMAVSEIIANSYADSDYSQLIASSREFFNSRYPDNWALVIEDSNGNLLISINQQTAIEKALLSISTKTEEVAGVLTPLRTGGKSNFLKITLLLTNIDDKTAYVGQ